MTNEQVNTYEGLFLFPHSVTVKLQSAVDHIRELLDRAEAQVISLRKWDERRLAYDIRGIKRGVYFLVYFKCPGSAITPLERSCNLSEQLLRSLFIRADLMTEEQIEAADGQTELADEIRLRSEKEAETASAEKSKSAQPVAVGVGVETEKSAEPISEPAVADTESG